MSNFLGMTVGQMCRTKAGVMAFVALSGAAIFTGCEFGKLITGQKTKIESVFDYAKQEYETYKEIKSEGIIAASYTEAKQKLDSIKTDRMYKKFGLTPPSANDSPAEALTKQLDLQIKLNEENIKELQGLINVMDSSVNE